MNAEKLAARPAEVAYKACDIHVASIRRAKVRGDSKLAEHHHKLLVECATVGMQLRYAAQSSAPARSSSG